MQLWTGSLWASRSEKPSQFAIKQPGKTSLLVPSCFWLTDVSAEPTQATNISDMIQDLAYRSGKAHLFYFYTLLLKLASKSKPAIAWLPESFPNTNDVSGEVSDASPIRHYNSKELATACLHALGDEMSLPSQ